MPGIYIPGLELERDVRSKRKRPAAHRPLGVSQSAWRQLLPPPPPSFWFCWAAPLLIP